MKKLKGKKLKKIAQQLFNQATMQEIKWAHDRYMDQDHAISDIQILTAELWDKLDQQKKTADVAREVSNRQAAAIMTLQTQMMNLDKKRAGNKP